MAAIFCCCIRMNHRVWCAQLSDYHLVCVQCFRLTAWSCSVTCASLSSSPVGKCNLNYSNAFHAPLIANGRFYVCKIGPKKNDALILFAQWREKCALAVCQMLIGAIHLCIYLCCVSRARSLLQRHSQLTLFIIVYVCWYWCSEDITQLCTNSNGMKREKKKRIYPLATTLYNINILSSLMMFCSTEHPLSPSRAIFRDECQLVGPLLNLNLI